MKNYEKVVEILEKHLDDEVIFFGEIASEICDLFDVSNCLHENTYPINRLGDSNCFDCGKFISNKDS